MKRYEIAMIAAVAKNNAIGRDNKLPWAIPSEMSLFTQMTRARSLVMGGRTAESIGPALKGRTSFVAATRRTRQLIDDGYIVFPTLEECLEQAANFEERRPNRMPRETPPCVFVIGGAAIYKELMPRADYLYISEIDLEVPDADAFFPEIKLSEWKQHLIVRNYPPLLHEESGEIVQPAWLHRRYYKEGSALNPWNDEWLRKKLTDPAADPRDFFNAWTQSPTPPQEGSN